MLRSDGNTTTVTGTGTASNPYVISANVLLGAVGTPTNMVLGLNTARPPRAQVWWFSPTGQVPVNFIQGTDVLLGPAGFIGGNAGTTPVVPAAPLNPTSGQLTADSVLLSWAPVVGAAYYEVAYSAPSTGGQTRTVPTSTPSLLLSLTGLTGLVTVQVRAVNTVGAGLFSTPITFTPPAPPDEGDFADADFSVVDFN